MFHMMHYGVGVGGAWFWLHLVLSGLFWAGLIALIIWAIASIGRRQAYVMPPQTPSMQPMPSALDILSNRYARGEIDAATYEEMRQRIIGGTPPEQPTQV